MYYYYFDKYYKKFCSLNLNQKKLFSSRCYWVMILITKIGSMWYRLVFFSKLKLPIRQSSIYYKVPEIKFDSQNFQENKIKRCNSFDFEHALTCYSDRLLQI